MNKEVDSYYSSLTDIERFILSIDTVVEFFEEMRLLQIQNSPITQKADLKFSSCQLFLCIKKPLAKRVVQKSRKAMLRK